MTNKQTPVYPDATEAPTGENSLQKLQKDQAKVAHEKQAAGDKKVAKEPVGKTPQKEAADEAEKNGGISGGLTQSEGEILEKPLTEAELNAARDAKEVTNLHPFVPGQNPYPDPSNPTILKRDQIDKNPLDAKMVVKALKGDDLAQVTGGVSKSLNKMDFSGMDLKGVNFDGKNLSGAIFAGANLSGASFKNTNLQGADFRGAKGLEKADFENADLRWVHADEQK